MSDGVWAAIITSAGLILVAVVNNRQGRKQMRAIGNIHEKTERVREQVENSHRSNFRDDLDDLRAEVIEGFAVQTRRQDAYAAATGRTHRRIEAKVDGVVKRLDEHIAGGAA